MSQGASFWTRDTPSQQEEKQAGHWKQRAKYADFWRIKILLPVGRKLKAQKIPQFKSRQVQFSFLNYINSKAEFPTQDDAVCLQGVRCKFDSNAALPTMHRGLALGISADHLPTDVAENWHRVWCSECWDDWPSWTLALPLQNLHKQSGWNCKHSRKAFVKDLLRHFNVFFLFIVVVSSTFDVNFCQH